jgi:hypothetical protein
MNSCIFSFIILNGTDEIDTSKKITSITAGNQEFFSSISGFLVLNLVLFFEKTTNQSIETKNLKAYLLVSLKYHLYNKISQVQINITLVNIWFKLLDYETSQFIVFLRFLLI